MTTLPPVVLSIEVATPVAHAFATFTRDIEKWWPAKTHSVGEERVANVIMEPYVGGQFYEEWDDGTRVAWGEVKKWDPPQRLVVSWHPGIDIQEGTEVEVTFASSATGTIVELTHRHWERRGALAEEKRAQYESGWPASLERFRDEAVRSISSSRL